MSLGLSQDVDGLAAVVGVLLLLNGDDAGDGVGVLVVQRVVGDAVVLVVGQQDVVAVPEEELRASFKMVLNFRDNSKKMPINQYVDRLLRRN